jgi:hypothetical protein
MWLQKQRKWKTAIKITKIVSTDLIIKETCLQNPWKVAHEALDSSEQNSATTDLYDRNT